MGERPGAREPIESSANKFRNTARKKRLRSRSPETAEAQEEATRLSRRTKSRSDRAATAQSAAGRARTTCAITFWRCMAETMISTENLLWRTTSAQYYLRKPKAISKLYLFAPPPLALLDIHQEYGPVHGNIARIDFSAPTICNPPRTNAQAARRAAQVLRKHRSQSRQSHKGDPSGAAPFQAR